MHSLVIRKRFQLKAYPAGCINDPSLIPEGDARSQGSASNLKLRTLLPDFQVFGKLLQLNYTKTHDKLYSLVNSIPSISVIVDRQFQGSLPVNQFWSYSFGVERLNETSRVPCCTSSTFFELCISSTSSLFCGENVYFTDSTYQWIYRNYSYSIYFSCLRLMLFSYIFILLEICSNQRIITL